MPINMRQAILARLDAYNGRVNDTGIITHTFLHLFAVEDGIVRGDMQNIASIAAALTVAFNNLGTGRVPLNGLTVGTMVLAFAELSAVVAGGALEDEKKDKLITTAFALSRMLDEVDMLTAAKAAAPAETAVVAAEAKDGDTAAS